jgi:hypothetical protein
VDRSSPWAPLLSAAGAAGAAIGLVYGIGGVVLSLRYDGFGLTGQQGVAYTSREVLLFHGARSLFIWALLGAALVLSLRALADDTPKAIEARLRTRWGLLGVSALALGLFLALRVWWPLAGLGAVLAILLAEARWPDRPLARFLASASAVALVAVAYEADRITYQLDWTCVDIAADAEGGRASERSCGILIGQTDRGYYIGQPQSSSSLSEAPFEPDSRYRLVFIPADRVAEAHAEKQKARVIRDNANSRREWLLSRLWDIEIR